MQQKPVALTKPCCPVNALPDNTGHKEKFVSYICWPHCAVALLSYSNFPRGMILEQHSAAMQLCESTRGFFFKNHFLLLSNPLQHTHEHTDAPPAHFSHAVSNWVLDHCWPPETSVWGGGGRLFKSLSKWQNTANVCSNSEIGLVSCNKFPLGTDNSISSEHFLHYKILWQRLLRSALFLLKTDQNCVTTRGTYKFLSYSLTEKLEKENVTLFLLPRPFSFTAMSHASECGVFKDEVISQLPVH